MNQQTKNLQLPTMENARLCVIGLGYVGLPLAVEFGKKFPTTGFDHKAERIAELKQGKDTTLEVEQAELAAAKKLTYSSDPEAISTCNIFIIAVPTPIDHAKRPDFRPLESATKTVASVLKRGDIVVYESTVYPGATEEICVPLLEKGSGLTFNQDFCCGYSPERINPGDKTHRLPDIVKITSGSTPQAADFIDDLYRSIITAGTFRATSIKVAEAAKVIENTQRDVNIALINELSLIFNKLNISTRDVLAAAATKWNFLPFQPGLVGGHCIGVDPYYLTHKAQEIGYNPEMIIAGRRLNDTMGSYIASSVIKKMMQKKINTAGAKILILGLTFKENCPDLRNTRVIDIISELQEYGLTVEVYDPWADSSEAQKEYGITLLPTLEQNSYDAVVIAVCHRQFLAYSADDIRQLCRSPFVIYDVKGILPHSETDGSL